MAQFTPGYTFVEDGVTKNPPANFNNLVDRASLTGLSATNFAGSTAGVFIYGSVTPTIARGLIWYDTTPGAEGCKFAYLSPSAGSISRWLYATPRREGLFWSASAVSIGIPHFLNRGPGFLQGGTNLAGMEIFTYDGLMVPRIWRYDNSSGMNPAMVIPTETIPGPGPVVCAWSGLVRADLNTAPLAVGHLVWTDNTNPNTFKTGFNPPARAHVWGLCTIASATPAPPYPAMLLWGAGPAIEDYTP